MAARPADAPSAFLAVTLTEYVQPATSPESENVRVPPLPPSHASPPVTGVAGAVDAALIADDAHSGASVASGARVTTTSYGSSPAPFASGTVHVSDAVVAAPADRLVARPVTASGAASAEVKVLKRPSHGPYGPLGSQLE